MAPALRNTIHRLRGAAHTTKRHATTGLEAAWPSEVRLALEALEEPWLADDPNDYCPRCGASAGPGSVTANGCAFCRHKRQPWDRVTRLSAYHEPVDGWVKAMKFGGQWSWARWMGEQLAPRVGQPIDPDRMLVTAVPMHWARRWRRGFNQAHLIAEALAKANGWRCMNLLKRTRLTHPQTAVVHSNRHANVQGSVAIAPIDLTGWQVLLVDDVKTTGATAAECTKLLKRHGARSIHLAVAAVADSKGKGFKAI
ncbi:ComF family protein [Phycisphaeraceae bacterium D3-23]